MKHFRRYISKTLHQPYEWLVGFLTLKNDSSLVNDVICLTELNIVNFCKLRFVSLIFVRLYLSNYV